MKRKISILMAVTCLLAGAVMGKGIEFRHVSLKEAQSMAAKEGKAIFIDVYATWCGPCKYLSREVFTDEDVAAYFNEHFVNVKIDGERGEGPDIMEDFALEAYPSLLFLDPSGKVLKKTAGAMGPDQLIRLAETALHPEDAPLYRYQQRYEAGERGKSFLKEYFQLMVDEESEDDPAILINEFISLYPDLDLEEELEFIFFIYGIHDLDHPLMQEYLNDVAKYEEQIPGAYAEVFLQTVMHYSDLAESQEDPEILRTALGRLHPSLTVIMGDEAPSLSELEEEIMGED